MSDTLLAFNNVSIVTTQGKTLVDQVSFVLPKAKVLGLIGESGAGKSTLGMAALGYFREGLKLSAGEIVFDGRTISSLPEAELTQLRGSRIAYVAQSASSAFNPSFTLGEQVIETVLEHGILSRKQALDRAEQLFALLGLPEPRRFLQRYPHQASGGQLQRAMIAMALCPQPDLIVFDEPTTALDVTTQIGVLLAIRNAISATGVAALYISHDLAVVTQIVDDILVLRNGKALEYGSLAQVINRPKHDYTRQLVQVHARTAAVAAKASVPILSIRALSMRYATGATVLSEVSLELPAAHTLVLVGQSGSGKSTLGRVLCGLNAATHGDIVFHQQALAPLIQDRSQDDLRRIQLIHQLPDLALNPRHTVAEIIGRPLSLYWANSRTQRAHRVDELLRQVELDPGLRNHYPAMLSGGQKQRICIARALAAEPEVIVCDEPTSALDPLVAQGVLKLLSRLQRETGVSLLFITHDIAIGRAIAHSIAVLHEGKIIRYGSPELVLSPPFDRVTDQLLSAVPEMKIGWLDQWVARNSSELV